MGQGKVGVLCGFILAAAAVMFSSSQAVWGQTEGAPKRDAVGVGDVVVLPALTKATEAAGKTTELGMLAESLSGQLIDRLHNTRKFRVIARDDLKHVLKEQGLAGSGNLDPKDPAVAKICEILGIKYTLVTKIDYFQDHSETQAFPAINQRFTERTIRCSVVGILYDTTAGEVLETMNVQDEQKDRSAIGIAGAGENGKLSDSLLKTAASELADRMANRVVDVIFPAKVLARTGPQITLNRGDGTGVAIGQVWSACLVGKILKDPDTGASLGREETPIGKVRIIAVLPAVSTAEVVEEKTTGTIAEGAILRAPPPASTPDTMPAR